MVDLEPEEIKMANYRKEMKEYATEIELSEMISRKVMKLRTDLIYGPEKIEDPKVGQLDFNYYEDPKMYIF